MSQIKSISTDGTQRYQRLFERLKAKNEGAFVPFVALGDPTPELSYKILEQLIESGADALELGIPFSDPLADGPEIQSAVLRAFANGINVEKCFEILTRLRQNYPDIPVGLLLYANLVQKNGIDQFYARCAKAGVDSVLVADVPIREYRPFHEAALKHGIDPIFICPPNATDETINDIAKLGSGYTYLVSRAGVTGMETEAANDLTENIRRLNKAGAPPVIQGFGIGNPDQAKHFIESGVDGVISGSAVTRIIRDNVDNPEVMLAKLGEFIHVMKEATRIR